MVCAAPAFFILMATAQGQQYIEVEKKYLKPEVQAYDSEKYHSECRRRDLGDCLSQVRLNPQNGHVSFLCKRNEDERPNQSSR